MEKSKINQWVAVGVAIVVILIFVVYTYARNVLFSQLPININQQQTVEDNNASTTPSAGELEIKDVVVGTGAEAAAGDTVTVNYVGTFTDGTKFDSSYDHGQTFSFVLGAGQVIQGWDLGIIGMKVGGKRDLIIPPNLGYGSNPVGPIPANSTLLFEVELLGVQKGNQ